MSAALDVEICADIAALNRSSADWLDRELRAAIAERGSCSVALSGGRSPRPFLADLAARALPWGQVRFFFVDERCVPPDDPESNFRMACEALFEPARIDPAHIHRMEGERADRDAAARDYEALLPAQLDVVFLGIGEDGHTASLFPGSPLLDEHVRKVAATFGPKPPPWRLTLTPPVLLAARKTAMITAGKGKAHAVARALVGDAPVKDVPARLVRQARWIIDREAAAELGEARK